MTDPGARPIERPHQTKQNTRNAPMGDAFTLCKLHSSSGALPVNNADERLLVDPDLRSHAEERPDPKTNPEPDREVVRARARGGASCGRGGAERHQRLLEVLVSSPKIKSRRRRAKKKRERPVARDAGRGAGTRRRAALLVDHL